MKTSGRDETGPFRKRIEVILGAFLLALVLCANKCKWDAAEARLISSVAGKMHGKRLDDRTLERLFQTADELLKRNGYITSTQTQPSAHSLTWAPIYGAGYSHTNFCCTVNMTRGVVQFTFYEFEERKHSRIFTSTEKERGEAVALANEIVNSIDNSLPSGVKFKDVSDNCPETTHVHWTVRSGEH